ncbi:MAG: hypothetical protein A2W01_08915 [Candidatus Solincola sediminis]|uniref:Electron transfer flavoprotein small subunit n=1 Tax=Candidatus Solincola sediminis TaxID=1797199 RepID=A0A1F2WRA9_9ACTN|nr:MAG: hypothetical protein A2Y75_11145 [Candidatus Solincola sediminis]OFW60245.1 MAG: hypothetical protein A2W01_08915 [Candidatus Solincola sediminis]
METLKIIVCAKQVPDPEGPPSAFEVDAVNARVTPRGIPPVLSPFDENALEAALKLKETAAAHITLMSAGSNLSMAVMLKALATGADELVLIDDALFDREKLDSFATASLLSAAIRMHGDFDLVLTGRQASDTNAGQVGLGIAALRGLPAVTLACSLKLEGDALLVERVLPEGYETVRVPLPAIVTVSHEIGELRYPRMADIKAAKGLPQMKWGASDFNGEAATARRVKMIGVESPVRERNCQIVQADTPEEAGERLALALREAKLL